jgi:hypothetical protein
MFVHGVHGVHAVNVNTKVYLKKALGVAADTGLWLMHVQYKRMARPQATP